MRESNSVVHYVFIEGLISDVGTPSLLGLCWFADICDSMRQLNRLSLGWEIMNIEDLDTKYLSAKALALVSEFALILYRHNGVIINVDADDVLLQVAASADETRKHLQLHEIYKRLRAEIRKNFLASLPPSKLSAIHDLLTDKNAVDTITHHRRVH